MHHVILRDDDANALTPPEMLESLYRPFLEADMPVHLATIPEVRTDVRRPDGEIEGYLIGPRRGEAAALPIESNTALLDYLRHEPGYRVVQHGFRHEISNGLYEFERDDRRDLVERIELGRARLREAGLGEPETFVAPQDRMSAVALDEVSKQFRIVSTGWFALSAVPRRFWPRYLLAKKVAGQSHWQRVGTTFLTHPGCILSYNRDPATILPTLQQQVRSRRLTVVVSHHWEYFAGGQPNQPLIDALQAFFEWLRDAPDVHVVGFESAPALV